MSTDPYLIFCLAALDDDVISILGYFPDDDELFGLSRDQRSFVSSTDRALTWKSIPPTKFVEVSADLSYVSAKDVPWLVDAKLQPAADPDVDYVMGTWGGEPIR